MSERLDDDIDLAAHDSHETERVLQAQGWRRGRVPGVWVDPDDPEVNVWVDPFTGEALTSEKYDAWLRGELRRKGKLLSLAKAPS